MDAHEHFYEQMKEDSKCPSRFLTAEKGDRRKAVARWKRSFPTRHVG
jgi:hypothetical protein